LALHAVQTGAVINGLEALISKRRIRIGFTCGDVNSALAASIVAAKTGVIQAQVGAGVHSGDPSMPEEVNRVVVNRLGDHEPGTKSRQHRSARLGNGSAA
jgi:UDP-N-acetylglucosamine 2-epimerase (non-hydrolysing)